MVKVYGPGFSLDASGTIGDAIVFSKWKGRNYIRERVIPANPKSGAQVGFRAMFAFLAEQWQNQATIDQATYDNLAEQLKASPFNAWMRANQRRFRNFYGPSQAYPAAEDDAVGVPDGSGFNVTAGVSSIIAACTLDTLNQNWGLLIFRSAVTGFATSIDTLKHVLLLDTLAAGQWIDTPLAPGTYYYNARLFSAAGVLGAELGEDAAIVS